MNNLFNVGADVRRLKSVLISWSLVLCGCVAEPWPARGGNALVTIVDAQSQPLVNTKCIVTALDFPQPISAGVAVQWRTPFTTDAGGSFTISNCVPSEYVVSAFGNNFLPFHFVMPATNGTFAVQNGLIYPTVPNLGTNYPTFAQGDLRWGNGGGGSPGGFSGTVTNTSILDTGVIAYQVAGGGFYPGYQNGVYRRIAARVFKEDGVSSVLFYGVDGWAIGNTTNCYIGSLQCVPDYYCPTNAATPEGLVFIPYNSDAPAPSVTAIPGTIVTNLNLTVFSNGICVTNIVQ